MATITQPETCARIKSVVFVWVFFKNGMEQQFNEDIAEIRKEWQRSANVPPLPQIIIVRVSVTTLAIC